MITTYQENNALKNFLAVRKNPMDFFAGVAKSSGDFSRLNIAFYRYVFVNDPELIREALIEKQDQFILTGGSVSGLARLLGKGVLTNHGDEWRESRNHLQPLFTQKALESQYPIIRERVQESLQRWRTEFFDRSFSLNRELLALSFRVLCSALFQYLPSFDEALEFSDAVWVMQSEGMIRYTNGGDLVPWLPLPRIRRVNKAVFKLRQIAENIVASGCPIPLDEIRSLLFAGTESPANTICWSLKLLENSPAWRDDVLQLDSPCENVDRFDSLARVICETMRLYPAGWAFERYACTDATLGGQPIAKGTRLFFSPYFLHRNTKFWKDPEVFDPSRFASSFSVVPGVPRFGYLPFGAGPRSCVGGRLAWAEMRITLAMILSQCQWQSVEQPGDPPLSPRGSFKMKLDRPMIVKVRFRDDR